MWEPDLDYPLLISMDVLEFIERLPRRIRLGLRSSISEVGKDPFGVFDSTGYDSIGRVVQIIIVVDYALTYWIDDSNWHVKILDIQSADR